MPIARSFKLSLVDVDERPQSILRLPTEKMEGVGAQNAEAVRLTTLFLTEAETVMESMERSARFEVCSFAKNENAAEPGMPKPKIPVRNRVPFRLRLKSDSNRALGPTEPPTERGIVGQNMRHVEKMTELMISMAEAGQGSLLEENRRQAERIRVLEEAHMAHLLAKEEQISRDHERRMAEAELAAKMERNRILTQRFLNLFLPHLDKMLPELFGKLGLAGKPGAPPGALEIEKKFGEYKNQLQQLLAEIDPETLTTVQRSMTPEQQERLSNLLS